MYKRQLRAWLVDVELEGRQSKLEIRDCGAFELNPEDDYPCLLYTSDAADERSSVDLGGGRILTKKKTEEKKKKRESRAKTVNHRDM